MVDLRGLIGASAYDGPHYLGRVVGWDGDRFPSVLVLMARPLRGFEPGEVGAFDLESLTYRGAS